MYIVIIMVIAITTIKNIDDNDNSSRTIKVGLTDNNIINRNDINHATIFIRIYTDVL